MNLPKNIEKAPVEEIEAVGIKLSAEKDAFMASYRKSMAVVNDLIERRQAEIKLSRMSKKEIQALSQAVKLVGIESEEKVGSPGAK